MRNSIELKKMAEETRGDLLHHCKYYVIRKKRFCKMTVKVGEEYCGEHQKLSPNLDTTELDRDKTSKIRIICPLDRKQLSFLALVYHLYLFGVPFSVHVMFII